MAIVSERGVLSLIIKVWPLVFAQAVSYKLHTYLYQHTRYRIGSVFTDIAHHYFLQ